MKTTGFLGLIALAGLGACYRETPYYTTPPPYQPDPVTVSGPPGGEMDPNAAYQAPGQPGYPAGYPAGVENGGAAPVADSTDLGAPAGEGSPDLTDPNAAPADPNATAGATATITDAEIDATLSGQGEWIVTEDYGRVWRPSATVVGVNFTPYESCGRWVYTDFGWTFQSCDEWSSWGWLAFHYGQWDWYDGGWCWVPDYYWSPAWVDWRYGSGYVGWRPQRPRYHGTVVRDHRRGSGDHVTVRDHRRHGRSRDSDWRFTHENDLGRRNIRAHTFPSVAEGLRATNDVRRPPIRGNTTVSTSSVMRGRLTNVGRPSYSNGRNDVRQPSVRSFPQPGRPSRGSYQPPSRGTYNPGNTVYTPPGTSRPPVRGTYQPPRNVYQPPSRGTYTPPSRNTYTPPSRGTYTPPSRNTYTPPSRGSYTPPSRGSYTPPSRSTYTPPSRGSYTPPSRSSYSPSHSSSSHSSARSSSSSSSSSRSSGSSSSSRSSGSSSSSRSSGGGGRRR